MLSEELLFIDTVLKKAGLLVMRSFGKEVTAKRKQERSQIVTEIDIASERLLINEITSVYPKSSIIAEESGFIQKDQSDIWIIDPIDGTSNFANGLPWFGVMIAHVVQGEVIASGIYLPVSREMYLARKGEGAYKNGKKFTVIKQDDLSLTLVAFGTDGSERSMSYAKKAEIFASLLPHVLNIRTTNSAVDYAYAAQGRIGGLITLENKIWDIAPLIPLAKEAGCIMTDVSGETISIDLEEESVTKNYTILLASPLFHKKLFSILAPRHRS